MSDANLDAPVKPKPPYIEKLKGLKILLVEDSPDNQQLVKSILTKRGAEVQLANNGLEGMQKASSEDFNVILMDMQMPVLDGYAATERLRQQGYTKPIIALTAHAMEEERKRTHMVGCDAHLTKPVDFETLFKTLADFSEPRPDSRS